MKLREMRNSFFLIVGLVGLAGLTPVASAEPVPVISLEDVESRLSRNIQLALTNQGYDPGPINDVLGKQAMSALEKYMADQNLGSHELEFAIEMLDASTVEACFWSTDGELECATPCAIYRLSSRTAAPVFSAECPGFDKTIVTREPTSGEKAIANLWQKKWGDLDADELTPPEYEVQGPSAIKLTGTFRGLDLAKRIVVDVDLDLPTPHNARVRCSITASTSGFSLNEPPFPPEITANSIYLSNLSLLQDLHSRIGQDVMVVPAQHDCLKLQFQ